MRRHGWTVRALGAHQLDERGLPSFMSFTRGAGNWTVQTAELTNGTTPITHGTSEDTARFQYFTSLGRRALIVEPAHTNLMGGGSLLADSAPDDGTPDGWTGSGAATVDYDTSTTNRLSTASEVLIHNDTGVASRGCYVNAGGAAATYIWSAYVRRQAAGAGNALTVTTFHENAGAWFDTALPLGPYDWRRHVSASQAVGGAGVDFYTAGRISGAANPVGTLEVTLPQLETGLYARSYTRGTCAAELCAINASVVGGSSGFVSFLWVPFWASTVAHAAAVTLFEWAPNWRIDFDPADDKIKVVVNGTNRAETAALTFAAFDALRVSVRYSSDGQWLTVNGTTTSDPTAWGSPAIAAYLGSRAASANCESAGYADLLLAR